MPRACYYEHSVLLIARRSNTIRLSSLAMRAMRTNFMSYNMTHAACLQIEAAVLPAVGLALPLLLWSAEPSAARTVHDYVITSDLFQVR
jgi:hypothetical protein